MVRRSIFSQDRKIYIRKRAPKLYDRGRAFRFRSVASAENCIYQKEAKNREKIEVGSHGKKGRRFIERLWSFRLIDSGTNESDESEKVVIPGKFRIPN